MIVLRAEIKCRVITWDEIHDSCKKLARLIEDSNYKPEVLIGLARSGFVPSRLISDFLGVTELYSFKVEHWLDTTAQHKDEATITSELPVDIRKRKVLVIDDIVDTGKSMEISCKYVNSRGPSETKSAVMHYITLSQYTPDYYVHRLEEWIWLIYPWNMVEDLSNLTVRLLKSSPNLTLEQIQMNLKEKFTININIEQIDEITEILRRRKRIIKENTKFRALQSNVR